MTYEPGEHQDLRYIYMSAKYPRAYIDQILIPRLQMAQSRSLSTPNVDETSESKGGVRNRRERRLQFVAFDFVSVEMEKLL